MQCPWKLPQCYPFDVHCCCNVPHRRKYCVALCIWTILLWCLEVSLFSVLEMTKDRLETCGHAGVSDCWLFALWLWKVPEWNTLDQFLVDCGHANAVLMDTPTRKSFHSFVHCMFWIRVVPFPDFLPFESLQNRIERIFKLPVRKDYQFSWWHRRGLEVVKSL